MPNCQLSCSIFLTSSSYCPHLSSYLLTPQCTTEMSNEPLDHPDEPVSPPLPTYRAARVDRPEDIAKFTALTLEGRIFDLTEDEIWWRDHYHSLLRHGYRLRHRLRPGWKPSWLGTNIDPFHCEDALVHGVCSLLSYFAKFFPVNLLSHRKRNSLMRFALRMILLSRLNG